MSINNARRKNMKKGIWKNQEVKDLFLEVEQIKDDNKPLKNAFLNHAKKYNRKPNSVRNYYYHEIDNLSKDKKRLEKLKIDLAKHEKSSIVYFSKQEEEDLLKQIDNLVQSGMSVRKACLSLSKGDVGQMLRYQNKYRNFIAKNRSQTNENINSEKIIKFTKKRTTLTDTEIQSLFMGLVRLVKRNTLEEITDKVKADFENANKELRQAIFELHNKEKEYKDLKNEFIKLKNENTKLMTNMIKLKCAKATALREKLEKRKSEKIADEL